MNKSEEDKVGFRQKLKALLHQVRKNKECYFMLLPFMLLFTVFTVAPVIMSLPIGFTDFNMVQFPKFVGLSNFYTLFVGQGVFAVNQSDTGFRDFYWPYKLYNVLFSRMAYK